MASSVLCKNCVHYTPRGECRLFKYTDLISGKQRSYSAYQARYSHEMCTRSGQYFKARDCPLDSADETQSHVIICSPEGGCGVIANPKYNNMFVSGTKYDAFLNSDDEYDSNDVY